uniref:Uncharacterized protein n=1 Tax=Anguilla anguilla TaxID=7936 RepID=A0A0E9RYA9_ANGAN
MPVRNTECDRDDYVNNLPFIFPIEKFTIDQEVHLWAKAFALH